MENNKSAKRGVGKPKESFGHILSKIYGDTFSSSYEGEGDRDGYHKIHKWFSRIRKKFELILDISHVEDKDKMESNNVKAFFDYIFLVYLLTDIKNTGCVSQEDYDKEKSFNTLFTTFIRRCAKKNISGGNDISLSEMSFFLSFSEDNRVIEILDETWINPIQSLYKSIEGATIDPHEVFEKFLAIFSLAFKN